MKSLTALIHQIDTYFEQYGTNESIEGFCPFLEAYTGEDWKTYVKYSSVCYARNYVIRRPDFEVIVLCWQSGQGSPIHNHAQQGCLLRVLEGELWEIRYCGEKKMESSYQAGQVTYIDNHLGLHKIENQGGKPAVSLHIYAPGFFVPRQGECIEDFLSPEVYIKGKGIGS